MILAAQTLPESSHSGYVAAAYIVFFVLVLVYVAIMAFRLTRVERSVREQGGEAAAGDDAPGERGDAAARGREQERDEREREVV